MHTKWIKRQKLPTLSSRSRRETWNVSVASTLFGNNLFCATDTYLSSKKVVLSFSNRFLPFTTILFRVFFVCCCNAFLFLYTLLPHRLLHLTAFCYDHRLLLFQYTMKPIAHTKTVLLIHVFYTISLIDTANQVGAMIRVRWTKIDTVYDRFGFHMILWRTRDESLPIQTDGILDPNCIFAYLYDSIIPFGICWDIWHYWFRFEKFPWKYSRYKGFASGQAKWRRQRKWIFTERLPREQ